MDETQNYIKALLLPSIRKPRGRKAWSIDLETVWLPFFTATNVVGDTHLPNEALGSPLRLAYDPSGEVKFSKTGRPIVRVQKDIADSVRMVRDNFTAGLMGYTERVIKTHKAGYKAQLEASQKAGNPIIARDKANLDKAVQIAIQREVEKAEAEAIAEAIAEAEPVKAPVPEKVPVTA